MSFKLAGGSNNVLQEVDASKNAYVKSPGNDGSGNPIGGGNANAVAMLTENDGGSSTTTRYIGAPEADADSRLRIAAENLLDDVNFNIAAQNTSKHQYNNTTMTLLWGTNGLQTNGGNVTTTTIGASLRTYAAFPLFGSGQVLYAQFQAAFSAAPNANQVIDFGFFLQPVSNPFAPTDGVYFRVSSAGVQGVINNNGTEVAQIFDGSSNTRAFSYTLNAMNKYTIEITDTQVVFWINDIAYYICPKPASQGSLVLSASLPIGIRHAIVGGAAGTAMQATFRKYSVSLGGANLNRSLGELGNAIYGSYQGLDGFTQGQLIAGTVTSGTLVKPTAAVPANTSLVANLPNSLGGRIYEQLTTGLAVNVDAIFASYTVPAGTVSIVGKRLKVTGIKLSAIITTVVVGGAANTEFYVAFGHTADSLATAEAATTKAPRRVMCPSLTQTVTAAQAVNTPVAQMAFTEIFDQPIYVNPSERIALVGNRTATTALTSGVISYTYQFIYSWE